MIVQRATALFATAVLVLAAACGEASPSGPGGPCAAPDACVVRGPDLALQLDWSWDGAPPAPHPATGLPLVDPGSPARVVVRVWNRGDEASAATAVELSGFAFPGAPAGGSLAVPSLPVGGRLVDTVAVVLPDPGSLARTDTLLVYGSLDTSVLGDDPIHGNDVAFTPPVQLRVPLLEGALSTAVDTVDLGHPVTVQITLHNRSTTAAAPAGALVFCLFDFDVGCYGEFPPFALTEHPPLAPGATWTAVLEPLVDPRASYIEEAWPWSLGFCAAAAGSTLPELGDLTFHAKRCWSGPEVMAVPDVEVACSVEPLAVGVTVDGAGRTPCLDHGRTWHVWRVSGEAGQRVAVAADRTVRAQGPRGEALGSRWSNDPGILEVDGRDPLYLLIEGSAPYQLTVTRKE